MKNTTDTGYEIAKWLGGAAAGALLLYMLYPDRGSARRAQSAQAVRDAGARIGAVGSQLRDRASALADTAATRVTEATSGSALERMGRAASDALDAGIDKAKDALSRTGDAVESGMNKARDALGSDGSRIGNGLDKASDPLADATGGLAPMVLGESAVIDEHEPWLTLIGLRLVYERNVSRMAG